MAMGRAMGQALSTVYERAMSHGSDTEGVALDVLAVALSIGMFATGFGVLGALGFAGGLALLGMDGVAYVTEMAGHDEAAENVKRRTEAYRVVATIATLPDAAWGGFKAIRELMEVRALRASSLSTAARADVDAARVAANARKAELARKYAAIGERARQRAAAKSAKLHQLWVHEIAPRATVPESVRLLLDDKLNPDNRGSIAQFLQGYSFHVVAASTP